MDGIGIPTWDGSTLDPSAASNVFVLGAGFSRAVDARMPLTDELGNLCLPLVERWLPKNGPTGFSDGFFETYLSALAADQPFLSSAENTENHGLFERFSAAIGVILGNLQHEVLGNSPPPWLVSYLSVAHRLKAGVVTFNYDTLLECLVNSPLGPLDDPVSDFERFDSFFWDELTGGVPAWPPGPGRLGATRRDTLRLLKLHGSLNWYWSPGDSTGATVAKRELPGSWLKPVRYQEAERQRELPGRVPFLVPPTATKSPFYGSPQLREFWQQARQRLADASHVFLLGYSLPPTDTTTGTMLRSALAKTTSTVVIADLNPEQVADRLKALDVAPSRIKSIPRAHRPPIETLCELLATQLSNQTLATLQTEPADEPLAVSWGNHCHAYVNNIHVTPDAAILTLSQPVASLSDINQHNGAQAKTSVALRSALTPTRRLIAQLPDGDQQHLIDHTSLTFITGRGQWRVLRPAGPSPLAKDS